MNNAELLRWFDLVWRKDNGWAPCPKCDEGGRYECALPCFTAREEIVAAIKARIETTSPAQGDFEEKK